MNMPQPAAKAKFSAKIIASTKKRKNVEDYSKSMSISETVWKTEPSGKAADTRSTPGHVFEDTYAEHIAALSQSKKKINASEAPFNEQRNAAASWNRAEGERHLDLVMDAIQEEDERPNAEQLEFLRHFIARLKVEILEAHRGEVNQSNAEPLLDLVHGLPGTAESAVIKRMRRLMEDGLGWEHGVQFVCLAFQNAMAAQINGYTIHHWTGIPVHNEDGAATGDKHKQSIKCQALRVVIIDEVSMISAELLGALEHVVRTAVRVKGTYKKRSIASTRVFGGVNLVMCGDFWQLHPVPGTYWI